MDATLETRDATAAQLQTRRALPSPPLAPAEGAPLPAAHVEGTVPSTATGAHDAGIEYGEIAPDMAAHIAAIAAKHEVFSPCSEMPPPPRAAPDEADPELSELYAISEDARSLLLNIIGREFEEAVDYALNILLDAVESGDQTGGSRGSGAAEADMDGAGLRSGEGAVAGALLETLEAHYDGDLPRASLQRVARRAHELVSRGRHGLPSAPEAWITPATARRPEPPAAGARPKFSGKDGSGKDGSGKDGSMDGGRPAAERVARCQGSSSGLLSTAPPPGYAEAIAMLQELKPGVSEALCAHVLRQSAGDSGAAAELLFSSDEAELERQVQVELARETEERRQQAKAEKDARRRAIERNDAVRDLAADGVELSAPRLPYAKNRKESLAAAKGPRYLDGQVVAHKGEKHIDVGEKEEWDGGSRGRVKTKGKRGPGWTA
jgi:hypothetical protein